MNRDQLIADLRGVLDDRAEPYLWESATLVRHLDESVDEACIRASLLQATTTQAITSGTREYAMPEGWYQINAGSISTRPGLDMRILGSAVAASEDPDYQTITGVPDAIVMEREGYFALSPVPDAAATLTLHGYRVPTAAERLTTGSSTPTAVPRNHHPALVHWAAARAYQTRDADGTDMDRSAYHANQFAMAFGPPVSAQLIVLRRRIRGYRVQAHF